jgi:hypothetical protein
MYLPGIRSYAVFGLLLLAFQANFFRTASDAQFRTWKDGSEALVLGKVFADANGIDTKGANLGFVQRAKVDKSADVLATYARVDHPDGVMVSDLTDENWRHGFSVHANTFLIMVAAPGERGYASDEILVGRKLVLPDGQERTVSAILRSFNYLNVSYDGPQFDARRLDGPALVRVLDDRPYVFDPYTPQFGIQGVLLSWAYRLGLDSVYSLQALMSVAMAAVLAALVREASLTISRTYAAVLFLCMLGSPWIVGVARNLYWAAFLWFLPAVVAMVVYRSQSWRRRSLLIALYGATVFLKSLAGYEYLSTVVLFSLIVFFVDPFRRQPVHGARKSAQLALGLLVSAIIGFVLAAALHSVGRPEVVGAPNTVGGDAIKYSFVGVLAGVIKPHELVPLGDVLNTYISEWQTPVLFRFNGFVALIAMAGVALAALFYVRDPDAKRDAALLGFSLLAPLSWFVLVQNHSAVHTWLNFVLWYFGLVPAAAYLVARGVTLSLRGIKLLRNSATPATDV